MNRGTRLLLKVLGGLLILAILAALGAAVAGFHYYSRYEARAAQFDIAQVSEGPQRSAVFDVNGELYSHLHGHTRKAVPLEKVSRWFIEALLAREDEKFWSHRGVDYAAIGRAAWINFRAGEVQQGASTITQQLARNVFELSERSLERKAVEALLAQRIERALPKERILECYVNRIYFGAGLYGIEAAAQGYFGKPASDLSLGEAAVLAGLIRSPNRLSPARDLESALAVRDEVLARMVEIRRITPEQAAAARGERIASQRQPVLEFQDDWVMDAVQRELERLLSDEVRAWGGLRVFTTIDPQLQRLAEDAVDRQLGKIENGKKFPHPAKASFTPPAEGEEEKPTPYLQGALLAVDNRTGAIRAVVGGRDYAHSKYHRAWIGRRQIGSTFKPFVYAAAFQRGMLPCSLVDDSKIAEGELRQAANWSPENSDGDYLGWQRAELGLLKSRNTMSVRVGEQAGLHNVRALAQRVGLESMPALPAAYLGAFETTLRELVDAYTVFPNDGVRRPAYLVARVEDTRGRVLYQAPATEKRVLSADSAWMTSWILQQVMKSGTASKASQLGWKKPGGGKTGTTNNFHDAWFVGYTTSLTCAVWVGLDKPQPIMERGYGSALALPVWVDFMQRAPEKSYPANSFTPPVELVKLRVCATSGARATSGCESLQNAYDAQLPATRLPNLTCTLHPELVPTQPLVWGDPYAPRSYPSPGYNSSYGGAYSSAPMPPPIAERSSNSTGAVTSIDRTPDVASPEQSRGGSRVEIDHSSGRPVRVLRAEPVDSTDTAEPERRYITRRPSRRVYRARPVPRERVYVTPQGRIVRIVPVEDW